MDDQKQQIERLISKSKTGIAVMKFGIGFCIIVTIALVISSFWLYNWMGWKLAWIPLSLAIITVLSIFPFKKALKVSRENIVKFQGMLDNPKKINK